MASWYRTNKYCDVIFPDSPYNVSNNSEIGHARLSTTVTITRSLTGQIHGVITWHLPARKKVFLTTAADGYDILTQWSRDKMAAIFRRQFQMHFLEWLGGKPLSEPVMVSLLTLIYTSIGLNKLTNVALTFWLFWNNFMCWQTILNCLFRVLFDSLWNPTVAISKHCTFSIHCSYDHDGEYIAKETTTISCIKPSKLWQHLTFFMRLY